MNNPDDFNNEEQSAPVPVDYLTILATTRPLVIADPTCRSLEVSVYEDKAISLQVRDWWVEFALKKGEIILGDVPTGRRQDEEGQTTASALPQKNSDLRIRIHLGMS